MFSGPRFSTRFDELGDVEYKPPFQKNQSRRETILIVELRLYPFLIMFCLRFFFILYPTCIEFLLTLSFTHLPHMSHAISPSHILHSSEFYSQNQSSSNALISFLFFTISDVIYGHSDILFLALSFLSFLSDLRSPGFDSVPLCWIRLDRMGFGYATSCTRCIVAPYWYLNLTSPFILSHPAKVLNSLYLVHLSSPFPPRTHVSFPRTKLLTQFI